MGRFKTFNHITVLAAVEGQDAAGNALRIERCERQIASTVGHVFIRTFVNGVGCTTEQFSRGRLIACDGFFKRCASLIVAGTPGTAALAVRKPRAADLEQPTVVFHEDEVLVRMFKRTPRFEVVNGFEVVETIPATTAWRAEQKRAIDLAKQLVAQAPASRWIEDAAIVIV